MNRPKFGNLFSGEWPYESHFGVGMRFEGLPLDKEKFITYLMEYSCHPKAGARIYERILEKGYDLLTVMYYLPFDEIAEGLKTFGVNMSIVPPQLDWTHKYSDGPYPKDFVPPNLR